MRRIALFLVVALAGCARLDHFQMGTIDQTQGETHPVSVRLSETGIEAAAIAEVASRSAKGQTANQLGDLAAVLAMLNMGPRTGNPVYDDTYAEKIQDYLLVQCPSGKLTAIRAIREARSAGPVSGEIVGVEAECINE